MTLIKTLQTAVIGLPLIAWNTLKYFLTMTANAKQWDRRAWFAIHTWVGLQLSIMLSFILITGTLAVFSYEIDWLLNAEMRVAPQADSERISWGDFYQAASTAYPAGKLSQLSFNDDPWWAAQATFITPSGALARLWFNPYSGEYQGHTAWFNVQRFLRMSHRHLMLPTPIGVPIVTLFAVPLLLSLVTGLVVYKKFWLEFFKWPRFHKPARVWLGDMHKLVALWSIWFLLIIALTSIWYLAEKTGGAAPAFEKNAPLTAREDRLPEFIDASSINNAVAMAQATIPKLAVKRIVLPRSAEQPIRIQGQATAILVRPRANTVFVDPLTGELRGSYRGEDLNAHQRLSELADPLHFGNWGGWASRIIWFLFGAMLSALSITGIYIYGLRIAKKPSRQREQAA